MEITRKWYQLRYVHPAGMSVQRKSHKITKDTQLPQIFGHMPFIKWKLQENDINYVMSILLVWASSVNHHKITKDTQLPQIFGHMPFIKWKLQENDINYVMSILLVWASSVNPCNFHLIKGMCPKICGNWVSFVILLYSNTIVYQKCIGTSIKVGCVVRSLNTSSGSKAEGTPTNNQRGRGSGPCRLRGGLYKARHIVQTAF